MNVEIYGKPNCIYCTRAKAMCEENNLPYVYRDIEEDPLIREEFDSRTNFATTVPQIFIGTTLIGGFNEFAVALKLGQIEQLLGGA
jgi:glutaredoxin